MWFSDIYRNIFIRQQGIIKQKLKDFYDVFIFYCTPILFAFETLL